jgi:cobalamin biosynthesis Mg chelatase CobN
MDKKYILIGIALLGIITWQIIFIAMPTKIALVNFRDSQMAELVNANDNWFIQPKQVDLKEDDFSDYVNFPAIYLFHISALTEAQKTNLKRAMENGNKVHVLMSTSKDNDFSNVAGEDLDYLKSCFENVGAENIRRWLNYSRTVFDEASLFVNEITEPKEFPKDVFYRIGSHDYFKELSEYWNYYKEADLYKKNAKTICIINSVAGPQD